MVCEEVPSASTASSPEIQSDSIAISPAKDASVSLVETQADGVYGSTRSQRAGHKLKRLLKKAIHAVHRGMRVVKKSMNRRLNGQRRKKNGRRRRGGRTFRGLVKGPLPLTDLFGEPPHTFLSDKQVDAVARDILKEARTDKCNTKKDCYRKIVIEDTSKCIPPCDKKKGGSHSQGSKHGKGHGPKELLNEVKHSLELVRTLSDALNRGELERAKK